MLIVLVVALFICFIASLTIGLVLNDEGDNDDDNVMLSMREGVLVDCLPGLRRRETKMRGSKEHCLSLGCTWKPQKESGAPWCIVPNDLGYTMTPVNGLSKQGSERVLTRQLIGGQSMELGMKNIYDKVSVQVEFQTDHRVRIKIYPTNISRWEIPDKFLDIEKSNDANANISTSKVNVTFVEKPFGVVVTRKDTGTVVFNSSHPGTLLADQFLRLTTSTPNGQLYGFGEHRHQSLQHDMTWKSWAMFTRDAGPNSDWNLYGQHPVYLNVEDDGKANILLLKNSNAMEVLLQPEPHPAVTFTTIGGVLDFYVFVGDSPADATANYIKAIGYPAFPPYWSLGYHLCRWGYANVSHMKTVSERNIEAGIPYDGQWGDIDTYYKKYMFTYDPEKWNELPAFVKELKDGHRHYVSIVDPGMGANQTILQEIKGLPGKPFSSYDAFETGRKKGIFVMNATGTGELVAQVWPGITVFPDFTNPDSQEWWTQHLRYFRQTLGVDAEAIWIDMNEPASFVPGSISGCRNNSLNYPSWCPNILGSGEDCVMYDKTICMDSVQNASLHYNVHSLYGHTMAIRTHRALQTMSPAKRPWTMTRSSFVGTGQYATKWQGDNSARWEDMHYSIIHLLEFGIFGFAMNGADICGFWLEPSFELCVRWHQLGAFYPFARNHNGRGDAPNFFKDQDPASFGQDFVDLVRPVLMTRYKLLPYLYTSLYRAHAEGRLMMQPLFYQFPTDPMALTIDSQFMVGDALLVSPVLNQGATQVDAYFPKGRWFDYLTGEEIRSDDGGRSQVLDTPLDKFNLHLRGGHVIPWQEPALTTFESRKNGLGLMVVLDEYGKASGEMFWDDGASQIDEDNNNNFNIIKFDMDVAGTLTIQPETRGLASSLKFKTIEIYGIRRLPAKIFINKSPLKQDQFMYAVTGVIRLIDLNIGMTSKTTIKWSLY